MSELPFLATTAALVTIAVFAIKLTHAIWNGRSLPQTHWMSGLAAVLLATSAATLPNPPKDAMLVAAVVSEAAEEQLCDGALMVDSATMSSARLRLHGQAPSSPACVIWVVVEDPRTGTLWLQGPAFSDGALWQQDVVLGTGEATAMSYRISVYAVTAETNRQWTEASLADSVVSFSSPPAVSGRLLASVAASAS